MNQIRLQIIKFVFMSVNMFRAEKTHPWFKAAVDAFYIRCSVKNQYA